VFPNKVNLLNPKSKVQMSNKIQNPNEKIWILGFGFDLKFGF